MSEDQSTKEPQYNMLFEVARKHGVTRFGIMANESWNQDPKRTLFTLSRYKFVARMFEGLENVLEVGCADAFGTRIVQQGVKNVTAVDFDPLFIDDVKARHDANWPLDARVHDMIIDGPVAPGNFDAAFALDVLEHINPENEDAFLKNFVASIAPEGKIILGIPSLESQEHASPQSKEGHVNCQSGKDFKKTMEKYFHTVFVFSMNDEVVHTGFYPLAHYLFAVCSHKKQG